MYSRLRVEIFLSLVSVVLLASGAIVVNAGKVWAGWGLVPSVISISAHGSVRDHSWFAVITLNHPNVGSDLVITAVLWRGAEDCVCHSMVKFIKWLSDLNQFVKLVACHYSFAKGVINGDSLSNFHSELFKQFSWLNIIDLWDESILPWVSSSSSTDLSPSSLGMWLYILHHSCWVLSVLHPLKVIAYHCAIIINLSMDDLSFSTHVSIIKECESISEWNLDWWDIIGSDMVLSQLPVGVWSDFSFKARFNVHWESFTVSMLIKHGCSLICVLIICPHSHSWCCVVVVHSRVAMSWVLSKSSSTRNLESFTWIRQLV